jgi:type II secretory pathway component GspD/PulD (secretin)
MAAPGDDFAAPADDSAAAQPANPRQPRGASLSPNARITLLPPAAGTNNVGDKALRMNFRGVPLEQVLNYMSDAAGFIIVLETQVSGTVDVWSNQPLAQGEAVALLNSVLNKNGYAAIQDGRTLVPGRNWLMFRAMRRCVPLLPK